MSSQGTTTQGRQPTQKMIDMLNQYVENYETLHVPEEWDNNEEEQQEQIPGRQPSRLSCEAMAQAAQWDYSGLIPRTFEGVFDGDQTWVLSREKL